VLAKLRVEPGSQANLAGRDPADRLGLESKEAAEPIRQELVGRLSELQTRLWAEGTRSVLLVLQGLDTSGKDGTIRHVFTGVNPQGTTVAAFKAPDGGELAHDYLWRVHAVCPRRGQIGVFNRSHYEDIVTVGVLGLAPEEVWKRRYEHVREFERMLVDEGTTVLKVFLHLSREEQRERFEERLADPEKRWKFRVEDLETRARWDEFAEAYDEAITRTSTEWAPWYVVPADRKWVRNVAVARLLVHTLEELDPQFPEPSEDLAGIRIE
jgi:PPK2 family polyphosphate:nucleotide phosphotransferase